MLGSLYFAVCISTVALSIAQPIQAQESLNYDPITGFVISENYEVVRAQCTACHSAKLVTQNRMTRENWLATIRWMQKTQGLWPLGDQELIILDYLETYYSPVEVSRRPPLAEHLMPTGDF